MEANKRNDLDRPDNPVVETISHKSITKIKLIGLTCQLDSLIERWLGRRMERGEFLSPFSSADS
jgi:hypothetical protein